MRLRLALLPALAVALALPAWTCPYAIRDSGFIIRDPVPYRLIWLSHGARPDALAATQALHEKVAGRVLDQANVRPDVLDTQREPQHPLRAKLEAVPTEEGQALLVSPDDRVTEGPLPESSDPEQALTEVFRQTVDSPKRQEIVRDIISAWCVVVVVEGADKAQNATVLKAAGKAADKLVGFKPEMGDPVAVAPAVVRVRADDPRERVLRWSVGLDEGDPRATRAAVLFGRGRRVGPVLTATQATEGRFLELFHLLGKNCTCTADPTWLLGPALPLNWGNDIRQQVREALGFDPDSPNVAATLSGVWKSFRARDSALVPGETVPEPTTGYMEFDVQQDAKPPASQPDPDAPANGDQGAGLEQHSWRAAVVVGGVIAAAAVGGSALVVWLNRRHS